MSCIFGYRSDIYVRSGLYSTICVISSFMGPRVSSFGDQDQGGLRKGLYKGETFTSKNKTKQNPRVVKN